jgi:hypothetical protein
MNIPFKGYLDHILPPMIPKRGKTRGLYPAILTIIRDKGDMRPQPHMGS